jgi:hypothetical protein
VSDDPDDCDHGMIEGCGDEIIGIADCRILQEDQTQRVNAFVAEFKSPADVPRAIIECSIFNSVASDPGVCFGQHNGRYTTVA